MIKSYQKDSWKSPFIQLFLILILFSACKQKPTHVIEYVEPAQEQLDDYILYEEGMGSWYGKKFHGRATASGEIYDMYGLSAAHKEIPLGTEVLVVNKKNNKKIKLVINDRGPFVKGRIIDLSFGAAQYLDYVEDGVVPVAVYIKRKDKDVCYSLQFAALKDRKNAFRYSEEVQKETGLKSFVVYENGLYKILAGRFDRLKNAEKKSDDLKSYFRNFVTTCK